MLAVYISFYFTGSPFALPPVGHASTCGETSVTRGIPIGVGVIADFFCVDRNLYLAGEWRPDRLNNAVLHER